MDKWTCGSGHGQVDMDKWTWTSGHVEVDMNIYIIFDVFTHKHKFT